MDRRTFIKTSSGALALALPSSAPARQSAAARTVVTYPYPRLCPPSDVWKVRAAGKEVFVYQTSVGAFAAFACDGAVEVEIDVESLAPGREIRVAPARHRIVPTRRGTRVVLRVPGPSNLLVEVEGLPQLFLYANPIPEAAPVAATHHFRAGQIYEVGELELRSGETVYLEGGAVVRGCVRASNAENVRILGHGVLDGGYFRRGVDGRRSIVLENCRNAIVDGIVMIEPSAWMIMLGACDGVTIRNVKQLGGIAGSDGVDIVGSRRVRVEGCMMRNGDDCIAVKALDMRPHDKRATIDYTVDVEDVEISGCSFLSYLGGQAMEIGHELRAASVRNIRFRDCDVLKKPNYGAPFGIHNADHAVVSDVLFERIRVEHHYDKLVDFRIVQSRWSRDRARGQVRNVTLRDVDVTLSPYNAGYTTSLIGGWDAEHTIQGVHFERFRIDGRAVTGPDDLALYVKHASDITFA